MDSMFDEQPLGDDGTTLYKRQLIPSDPTLTPRSTQPISVEGTTLAGTPAVGPAPGGATDTNGSISTGSTGAVPSLSAKMPTLPDSPAPPTNDPTAAATSQPGGTGANTAPVTSSSGQTFVGGTQPTNANGQQMGNGLLGYGYVPYSNGQLVDLGGGMVAPTNNSGQGISMILPPQIAPDRPYYFGDTAYNIGQEVPQYGTFSGYDPTTGIPVFNNSGPVMTSRPPSSLADLVDPTRAPASGGSGYANAPSPAGSTATSGLSPNVLSGLGAKLAPTTTSGMAPPTGPAVSLPNGGSVTLPGMVPGMSTIDPNNDLRSKVIAPQASDRLSGLQAMVDQAAQGVGGIDRMKLAKDSWDTFEKSTAPQYDKALREATQRAAANGQLGSGMLNTSYGDLADQRQLQLDTERDRLIQQALSDSVNDALNKSRTLSGLEGQLYGQEAGARNELRGERGYESDQSQQAISNALQQYLTQLFGQNQNFNQGLALLGAGSQGNPSTTLLGAANGLSGLDPQTLAYLGALYGGASVPRTNPYGGG